MNSQNTPVTEEKLNSAFSAFEKKFDEKIEIAVAQIVTAVAKSQENFATKDDLKNFATKNDLKNLATKEDIKELNQKVDKQGADILDIKRRVIDLEHDTPTQKEVDNLKKFVGFRPSA